MGQDM